MAATLKSPAKRGARTENDASKRKRLGIEIGKAIGQIAHWKVVVGGLLEDVKTTFPKTSEGTSEFSTWAKEITGMSYPSVQRYMQAARVVARVPAAKKFASSIETLAFLEPLSDADVRKITQKSPAGATEIQVREIAATVSEVVAAKAADEKKATKAKKRVSAAQRNQLVETLVSKNEQEFTALVLACEKKAGKNVLDALKAYGDWTAKASVSKPLMPAAIERMWLNLRNNGVQPSTQAIADKAIKAEVDASIAKEKVAA